MWRHPLTCFFVALVLLAGTAAAAFAQSSSPVTLTFGGDVMLGRNVGPVAASDPDGLFRDVRHILRSSDLAFANLESPLTTRPHQSANPNVLVADPSTAPLLATAGFDVLSVANNHAADAGQGGIEDTVAALEAVGIAPVGGATPLLFETGGLRLAVVAIDTDQPWDGHELEQTVTGAAAASDIVIVSVHGGVAFLPEPDPRIERLAQQLVMWGADVVWGHGPHVVQPVTTVEAEGGRSAVVATSLGNLLFDQRGPLTGTGALLQVRVGRDGVIGYRLGRTSHHDLRVHFTGWELPAGNSVVFEGEWWTPTRPIHLEPSSNDTIPSFLWGEVLAADHGPITGRDSEMVVSFRKPAGSHPVRDGMPEEQWTDAEGRTYHLGIYGAADLTPIWVAGVVPAPIVDIAACDGTVGMAYGTLLDPTPVSTGAAVWNPIGLDTIETLAGPGIPGCADIDGDGRTEAVILDR